MNMNLVLKFTLLSLCLLYPLFSFAQTDVSLFLRKDSIQIDSLIPDTTDMYKKVGHHGPAIENQYMMLRLYYRDGGAIDVYNKAVPRPELAMYHWYPTKAQIAAGAGCDEYRVGKSVGLGGIALWDGEKEVKLVATKARNAYVNRYDNMSVIRMDHEGVPYKDTLVNIIVRIFMFNDYREAVIEAECVCGGPVQFVTGVNYHKGQQIFLERGRIGVWGIHPADIVENPLPIGGGMIYDPEQWSFVVRTDDFLRTISEPTDKVTTIVVAASSRENELNDEQKFFKYLHKAQNAEDLIQLYQNFIRVERKTRSIRNM